MWLRQHKMHVGKWHVKTFFLSAALVLVVCLYWRMQTQPATSVEGGSRARRQGLIRVHAFGAKPYKSLPLTRRVLAQMRNKTAAAEKNKKRPPAKKGAAASLSVAQVPNRRLRPASAERKNESAKTASRKVVPSRNRSSVRGEASRRRADQTRRVVGRVNTTKAAPRKNTTMPGDRGYRPDTLARNRTASARLAASKRRELENPPTNKTVIPVGSAVAGNINRSRGLSKLAEIKSKIDKSENDEKKSRAQMDEDEDEKDSNENDAEEDRVTKPKSDGVRQFKSKDVDIGREKALSVDNKKPLVLLRENTPSKSDQKGSSASAKTLRPNEKEKTEKARKEKDEEKRESSRQGLERGRAGLAEDRPKASPKKTSFAETKKKQNDIKLEEDSLDAEIPTANKTTIKDKGVQASSDNLNENASKMVGQKKPSPDSNKKNPPGNGENHAMLEEHFTAKDLYELGTGTSQSGNGATSIVQNNNTTDSQKSGNSAAGNKINDEHFYIEGQLHFGNGNSNRGVANMRISQGDTHKSTKENPSPDADLDDTASSIWNALHAVLGSQKAIDSNANSQKANDTKPDSEKAIDSNPSSQKDIFSNPDYQKDIISNPGSQQDNNYNQSSQKDIGSDPIPNSSLEKLQPPPSPTYPEVKGPPYAYRAAEGNENADKSVYVSDNDVGYNGYEGEYDGGDDSGEEENEYEGDDYSDSADYDVYIPDTDFAYYQTYDSSLKGGTPMYGENRMYPQPLNRDRPRNELYYGGRPSVNSFYQNQRLQIPPFTQRQVGLSMNIQPNNMVLPPTQRGNEAGGQVVKAFPDVSQQNVSNVKSINSEGDVQNQAQAVVENVGAPSSVDPSASSSVGSQTDPVPTDLSSAATPPQDTQTVPEPELQIEDMASRARLQADARDSMQRYASLSAQANPGPVEIKPLAHEQRLQKVHTIP